MNDAPWWALLPAAPKSPLETAYRALIRVFADPTASATWGAYNPRSEGHQVLNFFENFRLDTGNVWVAFLARRLGLSVKPIQAAEWSYEYEDARTYRLVDVVVGFRDDDGPGAIVIEAKRTDELLKKGLSEKDDPTRQSYLQVGRISTVERKQQVLLVAEDALPNLPAHVRTSPQLITWEELAAVQRLILEEAAGEFRERFRKAVRLHHGLLGISLKEAEARLHVSVQALDETTALSWMQGVDRYVKFRKLGVCETPEGWLSNEPAQLDLIAREQQTGQQRQEPIWEVAFRD